MSLTLFIATLKKNLFLAILFFLIMVMYSTVMINMYNPESMDALNSMFKVMPPNVMKALGFNGVFMNLFGYLASWLYGLILTAFPMVYCILLGNGLVSKTVDSCSISCLLSTPNSRNKIIITKGLYALISVFIMQMMIFGFNFLLSASMFPNESMDIAVFLKLNITVALVNMTVMAIVFFFSCLFNNPKYALGFGAGVPIAFLLFNMLGNASQDAEILKNISIYGWYDPVGIVNGNATVGVNLIFIVIITVLFVSSVIIFKNKRLPI